MTNERNWLWLKLQSIHSVFSVRLLCSRQSRLAITLSHSLVSQNVPNKTTGYSVGNLWHGQAKKMESFLSMFLIFAKYTFWTVYLASFLNNFSNVHDNRHTNSIILVRFNSADRHILHCWYHLLVCQGKQSHCKRISDTHEQIVWKTNNKTCWCAYCNVSYTNYYIHREAVCERKNEWKNQNNNNCVVRPRSIH